ncbi:hypothetical protein [Wenyingzhuangia sp. IMCC45574]
MSKKILIFISCILLVSCDFDLYENIMGKSYSGFHFTVWTNQEEFVEFEGELFIGGVKEGVFIPVESIPFHYSGGRINNRSSIAFYYNDKNDRIYYKEDNSWNPNLDAIKDIPSSSYCFLLKISEDRQEIIKWGKGVDTAFRVDTKFDVVKDFEVEIFIDDSEIRLSNFINTGYRVLNDTERLLTKDYEHPPL